MVTLSLQAQPAYVFPVPGSNYHKPEVQIILKDQRGFDQNEIEVQIVAEKSENHSCRFLFPDKTTIIIAPDKPFYRSEEVSVWISGSFYEKREPFELSYSFYTEKAKINMETSFSTTKDYPPDFPSTTVTVNDNPAEGKIFFYNLSALASSNDRFISIIENDGTPVFYQQESNRGLGFTLQKNGYMSYWNNGNFLVMDSSYTVIDSFACGNGYYTDWHEFQYLDNGHALVFSYDSQPVDMSSVVAGGNPDAIVEGLVLQEIDEDKNVIFQWRSWDHYNITDATNIDFTSDLVSYVHGNAIEEDTDGNILLSARRLDEITKIDRMTGEVIWRLGGVNNQFQFLQDTVGFSRQHDIRRIENGNITLYDNGNNRDVPVSSAKEYELDESNMTAKLVWSFTHPDSIFAETMGSVQRLSNGNTFINWGWLENSEQPAFTEVSYDSIIVYELKFNTFFHFVYRARRFLWNNPYDTLGVESALADQSVKVYPNPCKSNLNVCSSVAVDLCEIYGVDGRLVQRRTLLSQKIFVVRMQNLNPGIYLLKLYCKSGEIINRKIIRN